ncbi:MAG: diguanylate cyclase [Nitrospirae bacterium YQR-1]
MVINQKRESILIVDDEPINIHALNSVLEGNYDITFAMSGSKALEIARRDQFDLILLDVVMPDINGFDVCRKLSSEECTRSIPVIFITANMSEEDEVKGLELGAVDYITKPIRPAIVKIRVDNHLKLKRYKDMLEWLSRTDGLTGIHNRRDFDDYLEREWKRGLRTKLPLSLILFDVDFFKLYNDTYGHLAGDACLKKISEAVAEIMNRCMDMFARYGGEEFACILPETNSKGAVVVGENIRQCISALDIEHEKSVVTDHVTVSLGVATVIPSSDASSAMLITLADKNLYEAKRTGRNCVIS